MFLKAQPLFFITQTPLHMGTGTDLGIIDMPIQRERSTSFPKLEASGLKGSFREVFEKIVKEKNAKKEMQSTQVLEDLFGPAPENMKDDNDRASALGFTDGRILFFPVKSVKDVYALVTCRTVLNRFIDDINMCQKTKLPFIQNVSSDKTTIYSKDSKLLLNSDKIILEEYVFNVEEMNADEKRVIDFLYNLLSHYYDDKILFPKSKLVILPDDDFRDFVKYSTEVITRTRIDDESGTVTRGGLFTEEYLPVNTIMYSLVLATPIFLTKTIKEKSIIGNDEFDEVNNILKFFTDNLPTIIQLGGNSTLGKGLVKVATGGIINE